MARNKQQSNLPQFTVWCRTCNGTDVKRVDVDDQDDVLVLRYHCQRCNEKWTSVYKKVTTKGPKGINCSDR